MKKYMSIMAIMLCAIIINVNPAKAGNDPKAKTTDCSCCKNCKDDKCKELCTKWSGMTAEQQKSAEGQKVKDDCMKICKEKKCCSTDGTCTGMAEGKSCCKKK